ncbi:MAG: hypothetical protein Q8N45_08130, partial [Anaerolineales bacterium]|nr:hypothetical protein [Anaerolineales bacterium]
IANLIADKLEGTFSTEIGNRENAVECAQQAIVPSLVRIDILLKKLSVGIGLNIDQVGNIEYLPDTAKILSKFAHNILSAFAGSNLKLSPIVIKEKNPLQPVSLQNRADNLLHPGF